MSPGGHLITTALTCAGVYALTGSAALVAGVIAGGFLIDVDHVLDYVVVEGQRDLRPSAFLRYYSEQRMSRVALVLHSYELLALLVALAWVTNWVPLWGYVLGVTLHLPLDIFFNGRMLSRNLVPFYSIAYRWRLGFRAGPLLGLAIQRSAGSFWRSFFAEFFPRTPIRPAAGASLGHEAIVAPAPASLRSERPAPVAPPSRMLQHPARSRAGIRAAPATRTPSPPPRCPRPRSRSTRRGAAPRPAPACPRRWAAGPRASPARRRGSCS